MASNPPIWFKMKIWIFSWILMFRFYVALIRWERDFTYYGYKSQPQCIAGELGTVVEDAYY